MINAIVLSVLLSSSEITAIPLEKPRIEARKRGKQYNGDRRRGGGGLR